MVESYLEPRIKIDAKFDINTSSDFDENLYFSNLKSKNFGTVLMYTELTSSTMSTFEK